MTDWQPYAEVAAPAQATAPMVETPRVALGLAGVVPSRCGQTFQAEEAFQSVVSRPAVVPTSAFRNPSFCFYSIPRSSPLIPDDY